MSTPSIAQQKKLQRTQRRAQRRAISAARAREQDDQNLARLVLEVVTGAGLGPGDTTTLYEATEVEPPTARAIATLQRAGLRVLVPITLPDLDLDWADAADPERTPLGRDAIATAGIVLTPGLSVDAQGTRLGQGGGCYDRALARRGDGVLVVTLLHPGETADEALPRAPHDLPVDGVLTAEGTRWVGTRG